MFMGRYLKTAALIGALLATQVAGQTTLTAQQAYDEAQAMREVAGSYINGNSHPTKHALDKSEATLIDALDFVRRNDIQALYKDSIYLEARQWDILRDLVVINCLQNDVPTAMDYVRELISNNSLSWLTNNEMILDTLGNEAEFTLAVQRETTWSRLFENTPFKTEYSTNLSPEDKLTGLSYLWSQVRDGFVYFDQVPEFNWDQAYHDTIPKVLATNSTQAYYAELVKLVAQLRDGHTNVYYPEPLHLSVYSRPPLRTRLVDNKVLITHLYALELENLGLSVGDEITHINTTPVTEYAAEYIAPFQSASTPQDLQLRTYTYALLTGDEAEPVHLSVVKADGQTLTVAVPRDGYQDIETPHKTEFFVTAKNIAYYRVNSFASDEGYDAFLPHLETIRKAKGLILDLRNNGGGSSTIGYKILSHFISETVQGSAAYHRVRRPLREAWGNTLVKWEKLGVSSIQPTTAPILNIPVVVLTSAATFSAAEDFLVAFKQSQRGVLIGQASGGSSGQPLVFGLPGGGSARVCVKRDKYANDTDWVGTGVIPDIVIQPTVADIREGFDPVLKTAVDYIHNH